jgi:hypothetical protein
MIRAYNFAAYLFFGFSILLCFIHTILIIPSTQVPTGNCVEGIIRMMYFFFFFLWRIRPLGLFWLTINSETIVGLCRIWGSHNDSYEEFFEDRGMFLRNVGWLSTDYTLLYPRRKNCLWYDSMNGNPALRKAVTYTGQHRHRNYAAMHPCFDWDSNLNPSVRAGEGISCLRPLDNCDRQHIHVN